MTEAGERRRSADSSREPSRLSVGIASTDPGPRRALLEGFCAALSAATQLKVTGVGVSHYNRLLEAIEQGEVDIAWLPPILAIQATARGQVSPIALPVRRGLSCYSTALFTREGSSVHSPRDLVGATAAWVDEKSAAGYLIIRAHLRSIGIDLERAFGSDQFLGSHEAVTRAVIQGDADVGATYAYLDPKSMSLGGSVTPLQAGWDRAKVRVIAYAGPIPSDVIAVSARVPAAVKEQVQRALVYSQHAGFRQAAGALFGAEGFIASLPEHLRPLTTLLRELESPSVSEGPMSSMPRTHR